MDNYTILIPVLLSFLILVMPSGIRYYYTLAVTLLAVLITAIPAFNAILHPGGAVTTFDAKGLGGHVIFTIDTLSGFFILVTHFTVLAGLLYSRGYLSSYRQSKSPAELALHNFSFVWLHFSMLGVLMLNDGLAFLIAWELMAVSSFMLILFEAEKRETLKTAVNYLIQMHVGFFMLVVAFLICREGTGAMRFDALQIYFTQHRAAPLFFLFFAGFAIKAGFIPLHTWLPEAHPAAPSHVSGVMSGVMIKMGIYGIVRVMTYVQSDFLLIGIILLIISSVTGLMGVMMAIVQHNLKKLLAYHSIENIGIIGISLGVGMTGIGLANPLLITLGFAGALLHVLNHSLFKPLLFFSAGSVYQAYHTLNMEKLGGVIHRMPHTAGLFLMAALAICGLPPLNGFISEFLIFSGLIVGLSAGNVYHSIALMGVLVALTLIGGLAIFCFTKAFGVVFLGSPRQTTEPKVREATPGMLFPQYLQLLLILFIGLLPWLLIRPLAEIVAVSFKATPGTLPDTFYTILQTVSLISLILILATGAILLLRKWVLQRKTMVQGPTWGCGYTAGTSRQQYTATSYASSFGDLAQPLLQQKEDFTPLTEDELFPRQRNYAIHPSDSFRSAILWLTGFTMTALKKIARLQTGNIQHYILYAFIYILIIFILLYLKIV